MDSAILRVFKEVAESKSISKAAQNLNYVQSNVTARIRQLEEELKIPLFYRHSRGMTLTSAGKKLLTYTNQILYLLNEAEKAVQDSPTPSGSIAIGSVDITAAVRLPSILSSYQKKFPQVEINLEIGRTEQLINNVLEYSLDIAFVDGPVQHPDIIQHSVANEELGIITALEEHFETLKDIEDKTLLLLNSKCGYRSRLEQWLKSEGLGPMKVMEFATLEGIMGCVKSGIGIAVLPRSYYEKNLDLSLQSRLLPKKYGRVPTVLIRRRDLYMTSAFEKFFEELGINQVK